STNLKEIVADADLVIEAIPEKLSIKQSFYKELGEVAPEKTIFATNSSTLLPSDFKDATGRTDRFLALHFANEIWLNNVGEIMATKDT
ncbi:3-hydroxyacyl-CoA dehydrogenase NAD-binding domain-containing protein, partial [Staphylococcus aureus]|nr:3-hydroxyacyl-CoA dehydrogenase NAD-binding domain-containing protein [Staphylococcus aureus]